MLQPIGNISKTMSKATLDMCILEMIKHIKLLEKARC